MHSYSILKLAVASLLALTSTVTAQNEGADFGACTPTMDFQLGRAEFNRASDEGTFFPTDDAVVANSGQSDALNPNIIANFICDQLVNVCEANEAAVNMCNEAQATVAGLEERDQTTADAFNQALGL